MSQWITFRHFLLFVRDADCDFNILQALQMPAIGVRQDSDDFMVERLGIWQISQEYREERCHVANLV
jgi:hypothetical protein